MSALRGQERFDAVGERVEPEGLDFVHPLVMVRRVAEVSHVLWSEVVGRGDAGRGHGLGGARLTRRRVRRVFANGLEGQQLVEVVASEHVVERAQQPRIEPLGRAVEAREPVDGLHRHAPLLDRLGQRVDGHPSRVQKLLEAHTHLRERYTTTTPCNSNDIGSTLQGVQQERYMSERETCRGCNGEGVTDGETCWECQGSGVEEPEQPTATGCLQQMLVADAALYERILDTPGFAFHFNELCKLATQADGDAGRYRYLRDNPLQLRAIDGNAGWCGQVPAAQFDAHTDAAMGGAA